VTPLTDRIAGVSLTTVVVLLALLTITRAGLARSRKPFLRSSADFLESVILAVALVFLLLRPFVVQSFFIPSGSMHPTLWEGDHLLVNKMVYRAFPIKRGDIIVFRAPHAATPDEKDFIKRVIGLPGDVIEVREGYVTVGRQEGKFYTRDAIESCLFSGGYSAPSVDQQLSGSPAGEDSNGSPASPPQPRVRLTTDAIWVGDKRVTPEEFAALVGQPGQRVMIKPGCVLRNGEVLLEPYVAEDPEYHMDPVTVPPGELFVMGDNRNDSRDSHVWGTFPADRVIGRADLVFWPLSHLKRVRSGEE